MGWERINSAGCYYLKDELNDGPGMRNARKFLYSLFKEFIKKSQKYYKVTEEYAFLYPERQTHSILFPAIIQVSDAAAVEESVVRRKGNSKSNGRIDFWVALRNSVFLIEAKHSWQSAKKNCPSEKSVINWCKAIEQIKCIHKKEAIEFNTDGPIVKIGLQVMPIYCGYKNKKSYHKFDKENSLNIFKSLFEKLSPRPTWGGLWHLSEKCIVKSELESGSWESYPAVMIFAYAKNVTL